MPEPETKSGWGRNAHTARLNPEWRQAEGTGRSPTSASRTEQAGVENRLKRQRGGNSGAKPRGKRVFLVLGRRRDQKTTADWTQVWSMAATQGQRYLQLGTRDREGTVGGASKSGGCRCSLKTQKPVSRRLTKTRKKTLCGQPKLGPLASVFPTEKGVPRVGHSKWKKAVELSETRWHQVDGVRKKMHKQKGRKGQCRQADEVGGGPCVVSVWGASRSVGVLGLPPQSRVNGG